jgi:hypothetical protein
MRRRPPVRGASAIGPAMPVPDASARPVGWLSWTAGPSLGPGRDQPSLQPNRVMRAEAGRRRRRGAALAGQAGRRAHGGRLVERFVELARIAAATAPSGLLRRR